MKEKLRVIYNAIIVAGSIPLLTACNGGGGGGGTTVGSLLGGTGGSSDPGSNGSTELAANFSSIASGVKVVSNPEPASMLLMGTGIAAVAFYKSKNK